MINLNLVSRLLRRAARIARTGAMVQESVSTGSPMPFVRRAYNRMVAREIFRYSGNFFWRRPRGGS